MKITFDAKALEKMAKFEDADLVLDFDQTLGQDGRPVEGCSIGTKYRVVAIDAGTVDPIFDVEIESNFKPLYFKKYGEMFLKTDMDMVTDSLNRVALKENGETIDPNVEILDYRHTN